jgi:transposase
LHHCAASNGWCTPSVRSPAPGQVLAYLSRYTHRIAISNRRLVAQGHGRITFTWRDYAHSAAQKRMTLDAAEFIRRFLLHVLPDGFQRIRHYGFLANSQRRAKLALIRRLLDAAPAAIDTATEEPAPSEPDPFKAPPAISIECCFPKLKQFRRVATRFEKTARSFRAIIAIAATILWLR